MSANVKYVLVADKNIVNFAIDEMVKILSKSDHANSFGWVYNRVDSEKFGKSIVELTSWTDYVDLSELVNSTLDGTLDAIPEKLNNLISEVTKLSEFVNNVDKGHKAVHKDNSIEVFYMSENVDLMNMWNAEVTDLFDSFIDDGYWYFPEVMRQSFYSVSNGLIDTLENMKKKPVEMKATNSDKNKIREVFYVFEGRGMKPGSFVESLIHTIAKADAKNKAKLSDSFPEYVEIVSTYQNSVEAYDNMVKRAFG